MSIAKDFANSIKDATKEKTSSYDTQAAVTRIEGKTAWVHIPGGVTETPVQLTVNAAEGDTVQVRVANGKAWITGNASAPPTDDKRANKAYVLASAADEEAQTAHAAAQSAVADAAVAHEAAQNAQDSLKSVVSGAQTVEKAVSVMQTALEAVVDYDPTTDTTQEYFWHDSNGAHVLGNTSGYRNDIDSTGMKIVNANTETVLASFGTETVIKTSDGTELAHFGYTLGQSQSGTAIAPYYTLGARASGSAIGNYSMAEGNDTSASGFASHAEGYKTSASGIDSHAEGSDTTASGNGAHAEGNSDHTNTLRTFGIVASGDGSHAEGWARSDSSWDILASGDGSHAEGYAALGNIIASGNGAHAQNGGTQALSDYQTAIGRCNVKDSAGTYAFIIGNGTSYSNRSNAFAVTWDGDVELCINNYTTSGDIDKDIYDALTALGWDSDCIVDI